jgi:hypothetical protein
MDVEIRGRIREMLKALDPGQVGDEEKIALTPQLEQIVAPGAAPWREIVRGGRAFFTNTTTAVASVVALPTTAVALALYNNEPDGGRSLILDWAGAINIVAGAATGTSQLIANLGQIRETAPTNANLSIKKANGMGVGNDSKALTIVGGTALPAGTGLAANWFPIAPAVGKPGAVAVGPALYAALDGRFIVPPGRYFALHTFSDIVTDTFQVFVGWHEVQLTLG